MAAPTSPWTRRPEVLVLIVVAVLTLCGAGWLLLRMHMEESAAKAVSYPSITQTPNSVAVPTVAFIGDSYSAGTGSSGYNNRFTTLVSAYEGWAQESFAYGGTGYLRTATTSAATGCGADHCPSYPEVIARVAATDPNIVIVSGGRNDVGLDQADVETAINRFYDDLRAALPKARIYVTSPIWAYSSPPPQLKQIQSTVRSAAARVNATYLDLGEPLIADRSLVSSDKVHPNNKGHAAIAQLVEQAISEAGAAAASTPSPTP